MAESMKCNKVNSQNALLLNQWQKWQNKFLVGFNLQMHSWWYGLMGEIQWLVYGNEENLLENLRGFFGDFWKSPPSLIIEIIPHGWNITGAVCKSSNWTGTVLTFGRGVKASQTKCCQLEAQHGMCSMQEFQLFFSESLCDYQLIMIMTMNQIHI